MSARIRKFRLLFVGVAAGLLVAMLPVSQASAAAATIQVSPAAGISGATVLLSGTGWAGYDSVQVELDQSTSSTFMCTLKATSTGVISSESCIVPTSLTQGSYTVSASDGTLTATTAFTLNPGITVLGFNGGALSNAAAGQTVGLTGSGFTPNSALHATFNGVAAALTPAATTTSNGSFTGTGLVIPASTPAGTYPLAVTAPGHTATDHIHVYAATLTVAPAAGIAGSGFTVKGTGWPSNDRVTIELNLGSSQNFVCSSTIDGSGTLAQTCTVPTSLPQSKYNLVVEDGSLSATTAFTLNPGITVLGFNGGAASNIAAGQTVGLTGNGFTPSVALHATFNGVAAALTPAATTTSNGSFTGTGLVIPASTPAGNYPLTVTGAGHTATVHVNVFAATLTVTPAAGIAGSGFTVAGTGWPSNDRVTIELNQGSSQNFVCSSTIDGSGTLAQTCTVPTSLPQSKYNLVVEDGSLSATTAFTLNPGITVLGFNGGAASNIAAGQTVGLTGNGFTPSVALHATFNGVAAALTPAATTTSNGSFTGTGLVIPASTPAGNYPLTVTGAGHTATVHVDVYAATLTVTPATGIAGSAFTVKGTGWPSNDRVTIELNQGSSQNFVCSSIIDGNGTLAQSCTLPTSLPQGKYSVVVEDGSLSVTTPLTLNPGIYLFSSGGQPLATAAPGASATMSGYGFAPDSTIVKLTIGTHTVTFATPPVEAGASGSFTGAAFTIPASLPAGVYTVTAKDASNNSGTAQLTIS